MPGNGPIEDKVARIFHEKTGRYAPGHAPRMLIRSDQDRYVDALSWIGFAVEQGFYRPAAPAAPRMEKVEGDAAAGPGQVRSPAFAVGEQVIIRGWRFRIEGGTDEGMFLRPLGPSGGRETRAARRRARREGE